MMVLSLNVTKRLKRLPSRAKLSPGTLCLCGTHFENRCVRGASRALATLVTVVLASQTFCLSGPLSRLRK